MPKKTTKSQMLAVLVLVVSWVIPGAGHVCLKRVYRGVIIFVTITATFWGGVAMGGVMTIDARYEKWWFVADMLTGVHGLIGWELQRRVYDRYETLLEQDEDFIRLVEPSREQRRELDERSLRESERRQRIKGIEEAEEALKQKFIDKMLQADHLALVSPMGTVARAYAGVAGLLNLMCIFDAVMLALMGRTGEPKVQPTKKQERE